MRNSLITAVKIPLPSPLKKCSLSRIFTQSLKLPLTERNSVCLKTPPMPSWKCLHKPGLNTANIKSLRQKLSIPTKKQAKQPPSTACTKHILRPQPQPLENALATRISAILYSAITPALLPLMMITMSALKWKPTTARPLLTPTAARSPVLWASTVTPWAQAWALNLSATRTCSALLLLSTPIKCLQDFCTRAALWKVCAKALKTAAINPVFLQSTVQLFLMNATLANLLFTAELSALCPAWSTAYPAMKKSQQPATPL